MPKSVVLFERLAYLAVVLGIVSAILNWTGQAMPPGALPGLFAGLVVISGLEVLFIWLTARKRKNWARWVWVAVIFVGTAAAIFARDTHSGSSAISAAAYYLVYLVAIASACCLLTPTAWAWFRNKPDNARIEPTF